MLMFLCGFVAFVEYCEVRQPSGNVSYNIQYLEKGCIYLILHSSFDSSTECGGGGRFNACHVLKQKFPLPLLAFSLFCIHLIGLELQQLIDKLIERK